MKIPTFAIIIGVSNYKSDLFAPLPAAQADARHLARSLVMWGIPESHITLLCDEEVLSEELEQSLKNLSTLAEPFQLVFYFCGHGYRTAEPDPKSHLIFSNSQVEGNSLKNGASLEKLLTDISLLNTTSTYLFIDACHLRLNSVINPKLLEEIKGVRESKKTLFCLLSSGILPSFESLNHKYGYFTEALIKSLSNLRHSDRSPVSLVLPIQKELDQNELPEPELYNIGTHTIDFLPPLSSYMDKGLLVRQQVVAEIQDLIVKNRNKVLLLKGPKGSGKTTLARQLVSNLLQDHLISFNSEFTPSLTDSLEKSLNQLDKEQPYALLVFDGLREATPDQLNEISKLLSKRSFKAIFISDHFNESDRNSFVEYSIPPLSYEETKLLIREYQPANFQNVIELYHLTTKGNPQKLKQAFYNFKEEEFNNEEIGEIKKAIAAIYACGLFINEELFKRTFAVTTKSLVFLEKMGLISHSEGCYRPHALLMEIAEAEQLKLDRDATLTYWSSQSEELPDHLEPALNLVLSMKCFGYEPKFDPHLKAAFQVLAKHDPIGLNALKEATTLFNQPLITPSSLCLAEILLEKQEFNLTRTLLKPDTLTEPHHQARITYSHLLWRTGLHTECLRETTHLINSLSNPQDAILCYLHRGASHYFLGNWEEALSDFSFIHQNAQHPKYTGWAKCLLGTIQGIRGIDVEKSKALIESGIRMLNQSGDPLESWMGWNNLGEMMWKAGELRSSAYYLQKALEISEKSTNTTNTNRLLETLRNFLQLELHSPAPSKLKINKLIEEIEQKLAISIETFEAMQLYNTLCIAYLYLKNPIRAQHYLKKAIPITTQSKEYHIYTLSNLSLICSIYEFEEKAAEYLRRARSLAQEGNNLFALRQINFDHAQLKAT